MCGDGYTRALRSAFHLHCCWTNISEESGRCGQGQPCLEGAGGNARYSVAKQGPPCQK